MKAIVHYKLENNSVEVREVPKPVPGHGEIVMKVKAVGICGSDIHQRANKQSWPVNVPVILGHEFSGVIDELGPSGCEGFMVGDRVTCETSAIICGRCIYCRSGQYQLCGSRKGFGYGTDGAMAEFVKAPVRILHKIPDSVSYEMAAMTEPACVAFNSVILRGSPVIGDTVVIIGPGTIGLLCLMMASLAGASHCILAGLSADKKRLEIGKSLGATHIIETDHQDLIHLVTEITGGIGADLVVDAAGVSSTLLNAMEIVRPAGTIVKVGWGKTPLNASLDPIVQKAVNLHGSFSHNYPMWERVIRLMATGALDVRPLFNTYSLDEWETAFDEMESGTNIKSIIKF
jgi:alcohol dehydrogenase/L-iditol 2-dehydrogenase